ncbi:ABC transporter permease [Nocardioides sp. HM23]|jgi:peptide/nickel transport system permease protein|uniref:ABC transporter permease n=1 Tax=Nocardioides bizhenqiangii TaxID=3095076 RepID=UPI002ACAC2BF|nr:ABC transporter permease [Nocardioides sp. HM23]MDZ5621089.1 ABC transporter permease [Nocardioides sp. HM23]
MTAIPALPNYVRSRRLPRDPLLLASGISCAVLVLLAVVGPLLMPYPAGQTDILASGQGPSADHWLGTDTLGRDVLSRALSGARLSLIAPAVIVLGSAVGGTTLAILSAWHGGWIDGMLNRALNVMFAVPGILVAVLSAAVFGAGFWAPVLALTLVYTPYFARVVRSAAVRERRQPYVEGLRLGGLSSWRICTRHLLRNVMPIVLAQATVAYGTALADFAAVSFLGLGIQAPAAEWGLMVADGRSEILEGAIQQSLVAGLLIVVTVVSCNILGERLAARLGVEL